MKNAKTPSDTIASARSGIDARSSTPTPALPPIPCTSADRVRLQRRRARRASARSPSCSCTWTWKRAAPPAVQQRDREHHDHHADRRLGVALHRLRQVRLVEHDRQRRRRRGSCRGRGPRRSRAAAALRAARSFPDAMQRRHGGEVVGVRRVAQAEHERDHDDHEQRRAVGDAWRSGRRGRTSRHFRDRVDGHQHAGDEDDGGAQRGQRAQERGRRSFARANTRFARRRRGRRR